MQYHYFKALRSIRRTLRLQVLLSFSLISLLCPAANASQARDTSPSITVIETQQQRAIFKKALLAIDQNRKAHYEQTIKPKLLDYPLLPYLDYLQLSKRLKHRPYTDIDDFLVDHKDTALGRRLLEDWLRTLAKQQRWHEYQSYYQTHLSSTSLKCHYLFAKLKHGEEDAYPQIETLWNVGKSQPKSCDPVFKLWRESDQLSPALAWQRHSKAIQKRKRSLARFLDRYLNKDQQRLAALYREVDRYPERIGKTRRFQQQSPEMREIILHGIKRLARRKADKALEAWEVYDAQQLFQQSEREHTIEQLVIRLAQQGHADKVSKILVQSRSINSENLVELMLRESLRSQNWAQTYHWLQQLPPEAQRTERWQYWRARAIGQLGIVDPSGISPEQTYSQLALSRGFYGFLSADIVNHKYSMVNQPVNPSPQRLQALAEVDSIKRAKEFFALSLIKEARAEWYFSTRNLDDSGLMATAKLAEDWGWYRKSIQAMIEIKHWDDLNLRFPLAYKEVVAGAAIATDIDPQLLFAIARQESAFSPDAKSPAGALGLMQLMPATAKQTARRSGVNYRYHDLLKPEPNIKLGSRYLNSLLSQFDGNRILAAAAYNAGPNRVKKWLRVSEGKVPFDVWIETIPYKETRGYVQNVLAFSAIYSYKLGDRAPMVKPEEAKRNL